jgi:hypothetical protein
MLEAAAISRRLTTDISFSSCMVPEARAQMSFGRLRLSTLVFVEMYSVTGHLPPSASLGAGFLFLNNVSINDRTLEYSLVVGTCYLVNSLQILPLMVSLPFIHQQSKKHVTVNINLDPRNMSLSISISIIYPLSV